MRIFGVILAGGQGQRMGGVDKALVPLAGAPLLAHVIARLEPQVERLALSAKGDAARFARFGLPVLPDGPGAGPLAGVLAALRWAAPFLFTTDSQIKSEPTGLATMVIKN